MSKFLYKLLDLLFYGNFWIALCAACMVVQSNVLLNADYIIDPITYIVFGGTLFIYGIHRAVGISRLGEFLAEKRYTVIYVYRKHIRIYALVGLIISAYFFFYLDVPTQLFLVLPALISALYVIPFYRKKRLRDFDHIKIYLIALVFAGLTVLLPNFYFQGEWNLSLTLMASERCLFIFLLTLPFDIRDLKVDKYGAVSTIPSKYGIGFTRKLMWIVALFIALLVIGNFCLELYNIAQMITQILSICFALVLGLNATPQRHDYYFTGAIDGMMILQTAMLLLAS